jgi:heme oxygenase
VEQPISHEVRASSLHALLRTGTAAAHAELDRSLSRRGYFASLDGYREFLERFWAFQVDAEQRLVALGVDSVVPDWKDRCRADLALVDLGSLGVRSERSPHGPHSPPARLAGNAQTWTGLTRRPEHALGVAYVLEGATLGGAVILARLARLGITAERGGRFLASYGCERWSMWDRFLANLGVWESRCISRQQTLLAARCAFGRARRYLGS